MRKKIISNEEISSLAKSMTAQLELAHENWLAGMKILPLSSPEFKAVIIGRGF